MGAHPDLVEGDVPLRRVVPTALPPRRGMPSRLVARAVAWLVVVDGDKPVGSLGGGQDVLRRGAGGIPPGRPSARVMDTSHRYAVLGKPPSVVAPRWGGRCAPPGAGGG